MELQKEIAILERANLSEEERQAQDEASEAIEVAKAKYEEAKQSNDLGQFISWVIENYVPEDKREVLPPHEAGKDLKRARWITKNVTKFVHTDKFRDKP